MRGSQPIHRRRRKLKKLKRYNISPEGAPLHIGIKGSLSLRSASGAQEQFSCWGQGRRHYKTTYPQISPRISAPLFKKCLCQTKKNFLNIIFIINTYFSYKNHFFPSKFGGGSLPGVKVGGATAPAAPPPSCSRVQVRVLYEGAVTT